MARPDIILDHRALVRKRSGILSKEDVRQRYTVSLFKEDKCLSCAFLPGRPTDVCKGCENNLGSARFDSTVNIDGASYWSLPLPDMAFIDDAIADYETDTGREAVVDNRLASLRRPMKRALKFTGKLYGASAVGADGSPRVNQQILVDRWLKHRYGIIRAATRSGKSVMAAYIAAKLGVRTLIVVHQHDLSAQFLREFYAVTNAKKLDKRGNATVQIIAKRKDLLTTKAEVCIITVQQFYKAIDDVTELTKGFSLLISDEVHQAVSPAYSQAISRIPAPYRLGLTATVERKDSRDKLLKFLFGPVQAVARSVSIRPTIHAYGVKSTPNTDYEKWQAALAWIARDPARNKEIVDNVFADLKAGHYSIIVPVLYRKHQDLLMRMIAKRAHEELGIRDLAVEFHRGVKDRKAAIARASNATPKRPCVLVAIYSMVKQALTFDAASSLHMVFPMSASKSVGAPMARQLFARVSTPVKKPTAKVTLYVDGFGMFQGAMRGLFYQEITKRTGGEEALYIVPEETRTIFKTLATTTRVRGKQQAFMMAGGWTGQNMIGAG